MDTIEELREEYDRLSDQGRDTSEITARIDEILAASNPSVYAVTTEIVRRLRHNERVQSRSFQAIGLMELYRQRDSFVKNYSWAIPTEKVIGFIRSKLREMMVGSILDVGCGKALWPSLINQYGCFRTVAYDPNPINSPFMEVTDTFPTAEFDCFSFIWPTYADPWAYETLKSKMPYAVLYIGEGKGGCTADDNFFELLERNYEAYWNSVLPNWPGIHDHITIYRRKT